MMSTLLKNSFWLFCFLLIFQVKPSAQTILPCLPTTEFDLIVSPEITAINGMGNTTEAVFHVFLQNNRVDNLVLETIAFRMGYNSINVPSVLSITADAVVLSNTPILDFLNGNFVTIIEDCCPPMMPIKNFGGFSYDSEFRYDHTVAGVNDMRHLIPSLTSQEVISVTITFDGTQSFSVDPFAPNYIGDPSRFFVFYGECLDPDPNINNQWGFQIPVNGPMLINNFASQFSSILLPIELAEFRGEVMEDHNALFWTTLSEKDTEWHIVEKSGDPVTELFAEIGRVPAGGNSNSTIDYQFNDGDLQDLSYYRLKSVDFDGSASYSRIVSLQRGENGLIDFAVFPNPVFNEVGVKMALLVNTNVFVEIGDMMGRTIKSRNYSNHEGFFNESIDVSDLPSGVYIVKVEQNGYKAAVKIVKQ